MTGRWIVIIRYAPAEEAVSIKKYTYFEVPMNHFDRPTGNLPFCIKDMSMRSPSPCSLLCGGKSMQKSRRGYLNENMSYINSFK